MKQNIEDKFLIHVDILGFEKLADEIAEKSHLFSSKVREDFLRIISEKVEELKVKGLIIGQNNGDKDDWLLVTNSVDHLFQALNLLLENTFPSRDLANIPLEIAIGTANYRKNAKLDGSHLIEETETITFLKTHTLSYYHEWHKRIYSKSITSSYVIIASDVYEKLDKYDQRLFQRINFDFIDTKINSIITMYVSEPQLIAKRAMILSFLQKVGKSVTSSYRRIESIFIAPNEYTKMIDTLEEKKIVFLVGDPEIGKTYTAARILWEYYLKGYTPVWNEGSEHSSRVNVRKKISEFQVSDHSVTYFEDPFGKFRFEDREDLRRTIDCFISRIQKLNSRVIITSREELFNKFKSEKLSDSDLSNVAVEMRLMKPSYDSKKMEDILLLWANDAECKWLDIQDIKTAVIPRAIEKLSTPLGLWDFAYGSRNIVNISEIYKLIDEKSKTVKMAFAEEITQMSKDKALFLSLALILNRLNTKQVGPVYENICKTFKFNVEPESFNTLQSYFATKVATEERSPSYKGDEFLRFTHPSYEEAIIGSWQMRGMRTFFVALLDKLVTNSEPAVRGSCGLFLTINMDEVPSREEAKRIIKIVLNDKNAITRYGIAVAVKESFKDMGASDRLDFVKLLANDKHRDIRATVFSILDYNLASIPTEEGLLLIKKGLEDRAARVRQYAAECVEFNINQLPDSIILKALEVNRELCYSTNWYIAYFASISYDHFKELVENKLGKKLADNDF